MTDQQLTIDQAMALAKKHAKNGQHATAKDIYERILAQKPDHAGARRGLKTATARCERQEQLSGGYGAPDGTVRKWPG